MRGRGAVAGALQASRNPGPCTYPAPRQASALGRTLLERTRARTQMHALDAPYRSQSSPAMLKIMTQISRTHRFLARLAVVHPKPTAGPHSEASAVLVEREVQDIVCGTGLLRGSGHASAPSSPPGKGPATLHVVVPGPRSAGSQTRSVLPALQHATIVHPRRACMRVSVRRPRLATSRIVPSPRSEDHFRRVLG